MKEINQVLKATGMPLLPEDRPPEQQPAKVIDALAHMRRNAKAWATYLKSPQAQQALRNLHARVERWTPLHNYLRRLVIKETDSARHFLFQKFDPQMVRDVLSYYPKGLSGGWAKAAKDFTDGGLRARLSLAMGYGIRTIDQLRDLHVVLLADPELRERVPPGLQQLAKVAHLLKRGELQLVRRRRRSSNEVFYVQRGDEKLYVLKVQRPGDALPEDYGARREAAAYALNPVLVPYTAQVMMPGTRAGVQQPVVCSIQDFISGEELKAFWTAEGSNRLKDWQMQELMAFDIWAGNGDRANDNVVVDRRGDIVAVDHDDILAPDARRLPTNLVMFPAAWRQVDPGVQERIMMKSAESVVTQVRELGFSEGIALRAGMRHALQQAVIKAGLPLALAAAVLSTEVDGEQTAHMKIMETVDSANEPLEAYRQQVGLLVKMAMVKLRQAMESDDLEGLASHARDRDPLLFNLANQVMGMKRIFGEKFAATPQEKDFQGANQKAILE